MTVYVAAAAGPDGALEAVRVVEGALDQGSIVSLVTNQNTGRQEGMGCGHVNLEGDDHEDGQEEGQEDPYLKMYTNLPSCLKPNITLVIVEALPRG